MLLGLSKKRTKKISLRGESNMVNGEGTDSNA